MTSQDDHRAVRLQNKYDNIILPSKNKIIIPNDDIYTIQDQDQDQDIYVAGVIGINNEDFIDTPNKRRASRYFDNTDISIKCYNCGLTGHTSSNCTSAV